MAKHRVRHSRLWSVSALCAAVVGLTTVLASPAQAATVTETGSGFTGTSGGALSNTMSLAQTFTATRCGSLVSVGLGLVKRSSPTNLTVAIYRATTTTVVVPGTIPTGSPLASVTVTDLSGMATGSTQAFFTVAFPSAPALATGERYAIVASTTSGGSNYFEWFTGSSYSGGNVAWPDGSGWQARIGSYVFQTSVDVDVCPADSAASVNEPDPVPTRRIALSASGPSCNLASQSVVEGTWLRLPDSTTCTKTGSKLLGWSTSATFPLDLARRQVTAGWGTWDGNVDGIRMIFLPVGASAAVTGDNTLYPVWDQASA